MAEPAIRVRNLTKAYRRGSETLTVLDRLDLDMERGEFYALMGPSGSGKTTLLNIVGALDRPDSGEVHVAGADLNALSGAQLSSWRARTVGFVFQAFNLIPVLTAYENVHLPLTLTPLKASERKEHALHALKLEGPLHTLLHPRLSFEAARAFYVGQTGELPSSARAEVAQIGAANSMIRRYAALRGGLPDVERRGLVAETCRLRPRECVALLAQWHAERPASPELAALELKIRNHPDFGRSLPLAVVPTLIPLFGGAPPPSDGDAVLAAQRESDLFVRYYHHSSPFSRQALADAFKACSKQSDERQRCMESLRTLEAKLGPIDGR